MTSLKFIKRSSLRKKEISSLATTSKSTSALATEQAWRRTFILIRPHVGADSAARGADHTRLESRHRDVLAVAVDLQDSFVTVVKDQAADRQRVNAIGAHVAEGHWFEHWRGMVSFLPTKLSRVGFFDRRFLFRAALCPRI